MQQEIMVGAVLHAINQLKSFKSLENFGSPTVGNNLMALILEVSKFIQVSKEIEDACRILNRYYIPTRYPNAFKRSTYTYV
jgi:HEPN domain-containing protein